MYLIKINNHSMYIKKRKINLVPEYTGYFTSDNEPGGIGNATHNTFGKQTWISTRKISRFVFQMYCGLHFQMRQAPYH
jgi:hypothetical protein